MDTIKDISESICQAVCKTIYSQECSLFIHNRRESSCTILNQTLPSYVETCRKLGGPKTPLVSECLDAAETDQCVALREGYCIYEGPLLENLEKIPNYEVCQTACGLISTCEYFVYDLDFTNCKLIGSPQRSCDLLHGPPEPSINSCRGDIPTTTTLLPDTTTAADPTTDDPTTTDTPNPETTTTLMSTTTETLVSETTTTMMTTTTTTIETTQPDPTTITTEPETTTTTDIDTTTTTSIPQEKRLQVHVENSEEHALALALVYIHHPLYGNHFRVTDSHGSVTFKDSYFEGVIFDITVYRFGYHTYSNELTIGTGLSVQDYDIHIVTLEHRLDVEAQNTLGSTCRDYTYDSCTVIESEVLERVKDVTEEKCQEFCHGVYSGVCNLFIYNRPQKVCTVSKQSQESYIESCEKLGGPETPSIEECSNVAQADPCASLLEAYCIYEGQLLENLEHVEDYQRCQDACRLVERCNYFVYDVESLTCELLQGSGRSCDLLFGLESPSIEDCDIAPTTTVKPPDTTTTTDMNPETTTTAEPITTTVATTTTSNPFQDLVIQVRDGQNDQPLGGASVTITDIDDGSYYQVSDSRGFAKFPGKRIGTELNLVVYRFNYFIYQQTIIVGRYQNQL